MDVREMIDLAERLLEHGHLLAEAAQVLRWAVELDGSDPLRRRLADVLVKLGQDEEARRILAEVEPSNDPEDLNTRALAQLGGFEHTEALRLLDRALELDPERPVLYANRGLVHFHRGDYRAAAEDLVRSAVVAPFHAHGFRYPHEPGTGDFEVLLNGYEKIREEAVGNDAAFAAIDAWVALVHERTRVAASVLGRLDRLEKTWMAPALRAVAACVRDSATFDPRRRTLQLRLVREALERKPNEIALLIRLEDELGYEDPERHELCERLTLLLPHWVDGHVAAASVRLHLGDPQAALAHVDRAIALDGEDWSALRERSRIRAALGDLEGALADLDTLVEIYGAEDEDTVDPEDWTASTFRQELNLLLCNRGDVKLELRDLAGARRDYDLAVKLSPPDDWLIHAFRAELLARLNDRPAAIADIEHALAQSDAYLPVRLLRLLARLKEKTGDREGAARVRERVAEIVRASEAHEKREARNRARRRARRRAARERKAEGKKREAGAKRSRGEKRKRR